jgi:hypothetical protein
MSAAGPLPRRSIPKGHKGAPAWLWGAGTQCRRGLT